MKADRQNVRSMKNVIKEKKAVEKTETEARENEFYMKTVDLAHKFYSDQTGRFPITFSNMHKCVMIVNDHNSNETLALPLKKNQQ